MEKLSEYEPAVLWLAVFTQVVLPFKVYAVPSQLLPAVTVTFTAAVTDAEGETETLDDPFREAEVIVAAASAFDVDNIRRKKKKITEIKIDLNLSLGITLTIFHISIKMSIV